MRCYDAMHLLCHRRFQCVFKPRSANCKPRVKLLPPRRTRSPLTQMPNALLEPFTARFMRLQADDKHTGHTTQRRSNLSIRSTVRGCCSGRWGLFFV